MPDTPTHKLVVTGADITCTKCASAAVKMRSGDYACPNCQILLVAVSVLPQSEGGPAIKVTVK